jgi:hypothetical protein
LAASSNAADPLSAGGAAAAAALGGAGVCRWDGWQRLRSATRDLAVCGDCCLSSCGGVLGAEEAAFRANDRPAGYRQPGDGGGATSPKELWLSVIPPNEDLARLLAEARGLGIRVEQHFDGEEWKFGGTDVEVLAPAREWRSFRPANNDSLVLKISYGATSALMEGVAEALSEARMVGRNPSAQLLKVGHHGSKTSATPDFLAAVRPEYAVISVGMANPFGLPKVEGLECLHGVSTYRTDMGWSRDVFSGWKDRGALKTIPHPEDVQQGGATEGHRISRPAIPS